MKNRFCFSCMLVLATVSLRATPIFSDDFNSYTTSANLVGQGPWLQTGTSAATPFQVTPASKVAVGTSGQDAYAALGGGGVTLTDGTSIYMGATLNFSGAQATGDYFLHFTPTVGNTTTFPSRFFAKTNATGGFVLGWSENNIAPTYSTTVLNFGVDYRVVIAYNDVAGTLDDTGTIYVNPTDTSVEANNTPYWTKTWSSPTAESEVFAGINLRQGTAGNAPTLTVDDLNASQVFSDVAVFTAAPVPEPQSLFLLGGFGALALNIFRRRK